MKKNPECPRSLRSQKKCLARPRQCPERRPDTAIPFQSKCGSTKTHPNYPRKIIMQTILIMLACLLLTVCVASASDSGTNAATARDAYGEMLPPDAIHRFGTLSLRHPGWIHCLAFSPDGSALASGDELGTVALWSVGSGKEIHRFSGRPTNDSGPSSGPVYAWPGLRTVKC